jgi:seryl-tRNA synthetase
VIDLRRLRDEPEYRAGIERKRVGPGLVAEVLALDAEKRAQQTVVEGMRSRQKAISKEIGRAPADERAAKAAEAAGLKQELQAADDELGVLERRLRDLALQVPNPADPSVPDGGEDDGEVLRVVGAETPPPPRDHAAFAEALGFVETKHAVEMSGSRFASLTREAVLVELALVQWVLTTLVQQGFTPVAPPVMVREAAMEEAGFFPTDRNQVYEVGSGVTDDDDDARNLFLVGTSEVPLAALGRGERFASADLPVRYAGVSTCFRREAGTYGKDTKGIFRVHQFDKVEMFTFSAPDVSDDEHERILAIEESIVGGLGLPYRVVNIAAGDLGPAAAKKYDLEVWLPSEGRYRELTSCSNYRDFSARRLDARVKADTGTSLVHTLNGTGCAVGRTLVFLFEHCQDGDTFVVPEVLRPYTGFESVTRA